MKIAVEGCAHGELDKIYDAIRHLERKDGIKIDLLICCGDFQSTRNVQDLRCMAVPQKYQKMCSFYKYYSGEKVAPVLTIFIGGNHEASNYLQELAYGGWVAPRIYYMGYGSIVNVAGVRIGGLSGIYKGHDYLKGHFEKPPYTEETKRSAYHIRNLEIFRFKQVQQPVDIFLSHDWPRGIYNYGEKEILLKSKPFFTKEVADNVLGSKPCEELLHHLKPSYWFSAHLHVKFAAVVPHISENEVKKKTKFLALDKCLPRRKFLQIVEVEHDFEKPIELEYDLEWLTIVHNTNHLLSVKKNNQYMPGPGCEERWDFRPTKEEMNFVHDKFDGNFVIPQNFTQTVVPFEEHDKCTGGMQPQAQINPQTMVFCDRLSIDDPMSLLLNSPNDSCLESSQNQIILIMSWLMTAWSYLPRRLSLALPSPQNSDVDEPMKNPEEIMVSSDCVQNHGLSHFPSPRDSDIDEPQTIYDNGFSDRVSSTTPSTDSDLSPDLEPKLKKFKRRNQSVYTNSEDDG
ncbi:hypothetical protein L9F63_007223 [Diploptera punctata]|uniref:Lariat debranching enzyme C-terminal domain-containing protein n=1 Tax=Diploptera punctata TaxID=6984 RepID=A0AAD7Z8W3_DIPPU|nr:hypothetical protein L9F63_007223 [Diploptera punctata]